MNSVKYQVAVNLGKSTPTLNKPPKATEEYARKGNFLNMDLCKRGVDSIHNMQVMNTNTSFYLRKSL